MDNSNTQNQVLVLGKFIFLSYEGVLFSSCRDMTSLSDFPMDPARYSVYTEVLALCKEEYGL